MRIQSLSHFLVLLVIENFLFSGLDLNINRKNTIVVILSILECHVKIAHVNFGDMLIIALIIIFPKKRILITLLLSTKSPLK